MVLFVSPTQYNRGKTLEKFMHVHAPDISLFFAATLNFLNRFFFNFITFYNYVFDIWKYIIRIISLNLWQKWKIFLRENSTYKNTNYINDNHTHETKIEHWPFLHSFMYIYVVTKYFYIYNIHTLLRYLVTSN